MACAYPEDNESPVSSSDNEEEEVTNRPSHDNIVEYDGDESYKEPSFDSTKFYPLNMCVDRKTEMYVKFAKVLIICQGPYPESRNAAMGAIKKTFLSCGRVITDELFCKLCHTNCTLDKTQQFLEFFVRQAKIAFEAAYTLVVVDASISTVEMNWKLIELAYKMQYVVLVVPPVVEARSFSWKKRSLANEFFMKGNPAIRKLQTNTKLPFGANGFKHLFCGWFLNDVDSEALRSAALTSITDCWNELPEFCNFVTSKFAKSLTELKTYYNMDDDRQYVSYCVVKDLSAFHLQKEYFQQDDVIRNYGRISRLSIVGFILSPDMVAARVALRRNQQGLWGRADMIDEARKSQDFRFPCPSDYFDKLKALNVEDVRLVGSKSRESLEYTHKEAFKIDPRKPGKSCHIVTGRRKGAKNMDVDYGVQFALHRELKAFQNKNDIEVHDLSHCSVKQIGQYWFINLKSSITVDGFFATFSEPHNFDKFLGQVSDRDK